MIKLSVNQRLDAIHFPLQEVALCPKELVVLKQLVEVKLTATEFCRQLFVLLVSMKVRLVVPHVAEFSQINDVEHSQAFLTPVQQIQPVALYAEFHLNMSLWCRVCKGILLDRHAAHGSL